MTTPMSIYFNPGQYDPYSAAGIALIGHELIHVKQWQKYGFFGFLGRYGFSKNNRLEKEAYAFGDWLEAKLRNDVKQNKALPCKR